MPSALALGLDLTLTDLTYLSVVVFARLDCGAVHATSIVLQPRIELDVVSGRPVRLGATLLSGHGVLWRKSRDRRKRGLLIAVTRQAGRLALMRHPVLCFHGDGTRLDAVTCTRVVCKRTYSVRTKHQGL